MSKQFIVEMNDTEYCAIKATPEKYKTLAHKILDRGTLVKIGHCKDCKWWKDSDGAFRRGIGAESQCPINREEVYEGNGYCFLFEPQESEEQE